MMIRAVDRDDLRVCGEIYASAFAGPPYQEVWSPRAAAEMLSSLLERDPESCWCVEEEGTVVGFAFCTAFADVRATVQEFAIAPGFQNRGFGTALMTHILAEFEDRGIHSMELVVHRDAPAFCFYQEFGFRQPGKYVLMVRP